MARSARAGAGAVVLPASVTLGAADWLRAAEIKRWRYALPTILHPQPYLRAQGYPPLFFGGDGFGSPRIEGAVLSGLAIGDALVTELGLGEPA